MRIKTFEIKVEINKEGHLYMDHKERKLINDTETEFPESAINFKALEVGQFNKTEIEIVKSFGPGEYRISWKLIV